MTYSLARLAAAMSADAIGSVTKVDSAAPAVDRPRLDFMAQRVVRRRDDQGGGGVAIEGGVDQRRVPLLGIGHDQRFWRLATVRQPSAGGGESGVRVAAERREPWRRGRRARRDTALCAGQPNSTTSTPASA